MPFHAPRSALLMVLMLAARLAVPAGVAAAHHSPAHAVEAFHRAINAQDIEVGVETFAEDAVVIQPRMGGLPQTYVGHGFSVGAGMVLFLSRRRLRTISTVERLLASGG
jgi:hypothetical protein